jgi:hypothetical protein
MMASHLTRWGIALPSESGRSEVRLNAFSVDEAGGRSLLIDEAEDLRDRLNDWLKAVRPRVLYQVAVGSELPNWRPEDER